MTDEIVSFEVYQSRQAQGLLPEEDSERTANRHKKVQIAASSQTWGLQRLNSRKKSGSMGSSTGNKFSNRLQVYSKKIESTNRDPVSSVSSCSTSSGHSGSSGPNRRKRSSGANTPGVDPLISTPLDTVVRVPQKNGFSQTCRVFNKKFLDYLCSKALVIQTFVVLAILCVPCNVVTFYVMNRISGEPHKNEMREPPDMDQMAFTGLSQNPKVTDSCQKPMNMSRVVLVRIQNGTVDSKTSVNPAKQINDMMVRLSKSFCESNKSNEHNLEHQMMSCFLNSSTRKASLLQMTEQAELDRETREEIRQKICFMHQNRSTTKGSSNVSNARTTSEMEGDNNLIVKCLTTMFYNMFKSKRTQIVPKVVKNYTCYESFKTHRFVVLQARRWFDGIGLVLTGVFGLIGNFMTLIVLHRQVSYIESTSNFNKLLMTLSLMDSLLILFYLVDVAMLVFVCHPPLWYRRLFSHFLFPGKFIVLSCSIYMVVAISAERYKAICYPLRHRPSSLQYISFVLFVSFVQNIPKFFEFHLANNDYTATPLTKDEFYHQFSQYWDKLVISGLLPFACLVFFNLRIYFKIRDSANYRYRFVGNSTFRRRLSQPPTDLTSSGSTNFLRSSGNCSNISRKSTVSGYRSPSTLNRSLSKRGAIGGTRQPLKRTRGKSECANDLGICMNDDPSDPKTIAADMNAQQPIGSCSCIYCSKSSSYVHRQRSHSESFFSRSRAHTCQERNGMDIELRREVHQLSERNTPQRGNLSSRILVTYCCLSMAKKGPSKEEDHMYSFTSSNNYLMKVNSIRTKDQDNRQRAYLVNRGQKLTHLQGRGSTKRRWLNPCLSSGKSSPLQPSDENGSVLAEPGCLGHITKDCHLGALTEDDIEEVTKQNDIFPSAGALPPQRDSSLHRRTLKRNASGQLHIRRRREKSTLILVAIVTIFILCHMVRLGIQAYRAINQLTMDKHTFCTNASQFSVPVFLYVLHSLSNLLVVLNSSVNFIVYCLVEESFRQELKNLLKRSFKRMAQFLSCQKAPQVTTQDVIPSCN
ncbi:hypothetical protein TCAL_12552 [Tigriopus californicus]|uniref:G-protein coupled receptors family 1 profile domain-containing protein n=1 Tax=Tigriopus californicus TaxID=6832 RepID=A0A553N8U8_TIGCA|nr:uncharacterized protein LOC131885727 [Tigriopus californicus]TRY61862.1 hypothetical protein TCAL_12552 [Tigriopus californicus]